MSRRKQHKPQHIQSDVLSLNEHIDDASLSWDFHPAVDPPAPVCKQCCAEFNALSDLRQHQNDCSPCLPVLIVNENEDLLSSRSFPAASLSASCWAELEHNIPSQDRSNKTVEFMDSLSSKSSIESPGSTKSDQSSSSKSKTDTVHCASVFPAALPQSSSTVNQGGYSWTASNVIIENLESTKVAMSQFLHSDSHHSKTAISSLLQQLLALQIQQIHQLQLIDQIRHQVLLFTSHRAETSQPMALCAQDQSFSKSTYQLQTLSAHLSQQLAAAAGIAKCLSTQSANMTDFRLFPGAQQSQTGRRDFLSSLEASRLITSVHRQPKFNVLSHSKMSSLMFSNNSFVNKTSETSQSPQPSSGAKETASSSIQNISAVVEDLEALAVLAQHSLSEPKISTEKSFFKRKCQLCTKVFGSDNSLRVHLRSHTGERPYKCNICGNRFSTRSDLKVHFQRHKDRYTCIPLKPRSDPEHEVHEVQRMCHTMFLSSEKANKSWDDRTLSPVTASFPLEQLGSLIKKEEQPISMTIPVAPGERNFDSQASPNSESTATPAKTSDSAETKYQSSMNPKFRSEEFEPNQNPSFLEVLRLSKDPQLQSLPEDNNTGTTDLNECIICHRIFNCQSALRMHYRIHTEERPYQCKLCSRAFTTKGNLKTHQVVHHTAVPSLRVQHSCPICQRRFINAVVLQQHIQMHVGAHSSDVFLSRNNGRFYETFKCMSTFSTSSSSEKRSTGDHEKPNDNGLLKWIKTERLEESNEEFCQNNSQLDAETTQWDSSFPGSENQASTSRLDGPVQTWFDPSSVTLTTPATTSTNMKLFTSIEDCQRQISSSREKGFFKKCDLCGKNFACQSALNIHYRSHTKERPFICTTCNRGFSTKGNLKQHMLTHQIREFLPSLLEASYPNQPQAPKLEMSPAFKPSVWNSRGHRGLSLSSSTGSLPPPRRTPKQHHCKTCGKSFSSSSALQIHERTHTGERPFVCTVCGRAFTTKGNLKVHMGTHMWNSAPSRRGRRLSVDRSSMGFGTRPVKLPEPPQKQTTLNANTNVNHWNRSPEVLSRGLQTHTTGGVQSGGSSCTLSPRGTTDTTPSESTALNLGNRHQADQRELFVIFERNHN